MKWTRKFLFIFFVQILLILNFSFSFAQQIKYSVKPFCKQNKVICSNPNEVPTCLVLDPKIHLETINNVNEEKINRFQPSCGRYAENLSPNCVDVTQDKNATVNGVVLECVEFIKCKHDETTNKLTAVCSGDKVPKCLGHDDGPNCETNTVCKGGSVPICDYIWQANALLK